MLNVANVAAVAPFVPVPTPQVPLVVAIAAAARAVKNPNVPPEAVDTFAVPECTQICTDNDVTPRLWLNDDEISLTV
jgi:hypothetical protein